MRGRDLIDGIKELAVQAAKAVSSSYGRMVKETVVWHGRPFPVEPINETEIDGERLWLLGARADERDILTGARARATGL